MDIERLGPAGFEPGGLERLYGIEPGLRIYTLLDFYSCYRAVVKMKISCLTMAELAEGLEKALNAKARCPVSRSCLPIRNSVRPAHALGPVRNARRPGNQPMPNDCMRYSILSFSGPTRLRKELPEYRARRGPVPFGTGIYRPDMRGQVYSRLLSMVQEELKKGRSAILDATFSRQKWREEAVRLAEDLDANILFFECVSSQDTILERLGPPPGRRGRPIGCKTRTPAGTCRRI